MKKIKYMSLIGALALSVGLLSGCDFLDFLRSLGFNIHTTVEVIQVGRKRVVDVPHVVLVGYHQRDLSSARGDTRVFDGETDNQGRAAVGGGRAPAIWEFIWLGDPVNTHCNGARLTVFTAPLSTVDIRCPNSVGIFFTMSPEEIDVQAPPPTVTFMGQGVDATYGMPTINYYNADGVIVAQTTATAVASDGTWLTAATPAMDVSQFYGGSYIVGIDNAMPDGTWNNIGYASVWLWNSNLPPEPEPDPDPCETIDSRTGQPACDIYQTY